MNLADLLFEKRKIGTEKIYLLYYTKNIILYLMILTKY